MKGILAILGDTVAATLLLIAGLGLHSALDAPSWLLAVFALPFLGFLNLRLGLGIRFIIKFIVLFTAVSIAFTLFLPKEYWMFNGGLVVVLMSGFGGGGRTRQKVSP